MPPWLAGENSQNHPTAWKGGDRVEFDDPNLYSTGLDWQRGIQVRRWLSCARGMMHVCLRENLLLLKL